ncbi:hypothetical protein L7F22_066869 [Adiantum nelumboides]|nr:hypothetical protein [Adiantum nelumboides]
MDWSALQIDNENELQDSTGCSICCLEADQLLVILQKLPLLSILAFGMTCRRFRVLVDSDTLWAHVCRQEWGNIAVDAWLKFGRNAKVGWKSLHRQMLALKSITWQRLQQGDISPSARASHSMVSFFEKVTVFGGGYNGGRHLDDTWSAPFPEDFSNSIQWQQISIGIPGGRFAHSCTLVGNVLILFGGINDHGTRQNDTWINKGLNASNMGGQNSWQSLKVAEAPSPRGAHAGCYAGDKKVVIYGGIQSDGIRLDDTWVLDLSERPLPTWHKVVTACSPPARSGHTLTWVGGKQTILFGGRGTKFEVMNDVWLLDMETESPEWVELRSGELHAVRSFPPPRMGHCSPAAQAGHSFPAPRAGHSATLIFGGRVLIYGGEDSRRCRKGDVWLLDPMAGIPIRHGSSTLVARSEGGSRSGRRFWRKLKQWGERPSKRSFHAACTVRSGCGVLVFGGMVDGELMPAAAGGLGFDAELFLLQLTP